MENYLDYMTIIYSKKTGEIYSASMGFQGLSIFDKFESEFRLIFDEMTTIYNELVIQSPQKFALNLMTNEITRLEENNLVPPIESIDFKKDIESLKIDKGIQDDKIISNMLATTELFEMILMMSPMSINKKGSDFKMVEVYVTLIIEGVKTIEEVPSIIRPKVIERLKQLGIQI